VVVRLERGRPDRIWEKMTSVLQEKKSAQPLKDRSCGCIFKNPEHRSAGKLLDAAGMKGRRCGQAMVSDLHANFILNRGKASFEDYHALISEGRRRVMEQFGVVLEQEVVTWGENAAGEDLMTGL